ncbi:MAG: Yip1 family protein [Candidatus Bilamarchaeaceae archaeon]
MPRRINIEKGNIANEKKTMHEESKLETHESTHESADPGEVKKEKNFQDQLEEYADRIVASIGYDRLKIWKEVFFHPTKTLAEEIKNKSVKRGAKDVFVAALIPLLLEFIVILIILAYFWLMTLPLTILLTMATKGLGLPILIAMSIVAIIIGLVLYFALPIISWLFVSGVQYVVAKLLGGKADFRAHAYLIALASASATAAGIPFVFLGFVPCLNIIAGPIRTLIGFYCLYLQYKAIRLAHGIDMPQAIITVFSPIIVIIGLVVGLYVAFYIGLLSMAFAPLMAYSLKS